jgi:phytoene dehydrogenase-like protein
MSARAAHDAVVVGAGLAGLACAAALAARGIRPLVLEASDGPGGRVRTDLCRGFLLDRGFQVLLTAYPEAQRWFDYRALHLKAFAPGALVVHGGRFHRVSDPWRAPLRALGTLFSPVGSLAEKRRVAALRGRARQGSLSELHERPARTTLEHLREAGISGTLLERFFRPFLGGIFLERELVTSSRVFEFVFRMFAEGSAALPARGMGRLATALAERLAPQTVRYGARVERVDETGVTLASGERVAARATVVAVEGPEAARLLGAAPPPPGRGVTCLYFAADRAPVREPLLVLDGEGTGPVNNLCVPSVVAPGYAPDGMALVSASVLGLPAAGDAELERAVRTQLGRWFGGEVEGWRHLRTYRIAHALPDQRPELLDPVERPARVRPGLFVCGDGRDSGSLQGALASGRRAAEALAQSRDWAGLTTA